MPALNAYDEIPTYDPENDTLIVVVKNGSTFQTRRLKIKTLFGNPDSGLTPTGETWTYNAWTANPGIATINAPSDARLKYAVDMLVRFEQATGGVKWGRIVNVTTTTIVAKLLNDAVLVSNEDILNPLYTSVYMPAGAPASARSAALGYAEAAATQVVSVTGVVPLTGLSKTVYVPAGTGRRCRITGFLPALSTGAANNAVTLRVREAEATLATARTNVDLNKTEGPLIAMYSAELTPGLHTFHLAVSQDSATGVDYQMSTASKGFILIEEIT